MYLGKQQGWVKDGVCLCLALISCLGQHERLLGRFDMLLMQSKIKGDISTIVEHLINIMQVNCFSFSALNF